MIIHSRRFRGDRHRGGEARASGVLLGGAIVLGILSLVAGDATAQSLDKGEQGCVNQLNKGGAKVAATQGKDNSACVKNAPKGKLSGTAEACLTGDVKGKVAKAISKNDAGETKKCGKDKKSGVQIDPAFGTANAAAGGTAKAAIGNDATVSEELALLHDVFGPDLDAAITPIDKADPQTKVDAGCQAAIIGGYEKLAATKIKQFLACKKAGLSGKTTPQLADAAGLAGCVLGRSDSIDGDPKGKIGKAKTKLGAALAKKCVNKKTSTPVDTDAVFPGNCIGRVDTDFTACVDERVECRVCLMLNAMDNMSADCDLFDDDVANSSCGGGGPSCNCPGFSKIKFTTGVPTGNGGNLQNFRCSNANTVACVDATDCDLGYCQTSGPFAGTCSGDLSVSCVTTADCAGTCDEQTGSGLPQSLVNGGLYTGSGKNSVPLPLPIPDKGESFMKITSCNGDTLNLAATTETEAGTMFGCTTGRTCSGSGTTCVLDGDCPVTQTCVTNCIFGPQLPIPNSTPGNEATSVCTVNDVAGDASGTASCTTGSQDGLVPLRSNVYLNGDLLSSSGPTNVPGIQPCPLCTKQCSTTRGPCSSDADCRACVGGTNAGDFCRANCSTTTSKTCVLDSDCPATETCVPADSDCDSGTCGATAETCSTGFSCLGGPGDTDPCTPDTSGPGVLSSAFPTSHDCALDANQLITSAIGGLPVELALTTGSVVRNAVDQPQSKRTFSGFCRDVTSSGSLCFEGDPTTSGCPVTGDSNGVPCFSDADCTAPFESCAQPNPGAFSKAAATRITVTGSPAGDLSDGNPHASNLVSIFDIAPTFNKLVDQAGDIPGPGASLLGGDAQLLP